MDYLDFKKIGFNLNFFWYRARRSLIKLLLIKYKVKNMLVLEVGCGVGGQLDSLSNFGNRVLGSDINHEALKKASDLGFNVFYQNMVDPVIEVDKYDVICAFDVLEHIEDDDLAISNIYRSLKSHGLFIFSVPAFQFLFSSHDVYMKHYRRYSKSEIKNKIINNNFELLDIFYWNFILFFPTAIMRLFSKKNKPKSDAQIIPKFLNLFLFNILSFENFLIKLGLKFPLGVSIFGVAKKK